MITDKEIEEAASNWNRENGYEPYPPSHKYNRFKAGAHFAQKTILERAISSFEEASDTWQDLDEWNKSPSELEAFESGYKAAVLLKEAEIAELKSRLEKQEAQIREADSLAEFYGDETLYFGYAYECSARIKVDQGKRARAYLEKYKNGGRDGVED